MNALGGQGGGVLADWIVSLGEAEGWVAQATSVPGVAQRTGATVYYLELCPPDPVGRSPIQALMPVPGDVDIVIASELMEAGRAIARGLVNRPPVILADEPTAPLDSERAMAVIRILNDMARKFETAIIVVTHDEKIIPTFKRIYHIRDGVTHEEAGEGREFE